MSNDVNIQAINEKIARESAVVDVLMHEMHKIIVGQEHTIRSLFIGLLADGHILLEGLPGLAKTLMINTLAKICHVHFSRIQFTPDLLPSDILGTQIFSPKTDSFSIKKGPIFSNFILADEINRAPAKVQSALLEVMQEKQVTIANETYRLQEPFLVFATQNPLEQEGTYPLPEAQQDRFMLKVILHYPTKAEEKKIVEHHLMGIKMPQPQAILSPEQIQHLRACVREVYVDEKIMHYIVDLVNATRTPKAHNLKEYELLISYGASPRASIALVKAAQAHAFIKHRGYVIPEDVRAVAKDVLRHRIGLSYEAEAEGINVENIIDAVLNAVEVP
jgi:MoxR-like ATPase